MTNNKKKVVYLIGAGASHGSVKSVGCERGILMSDLAQPLESAIGRLVQPKNGKYRTLRRLVNDIITDETDFEHIITFLDESPSAIHRQFANKLRDIFAKVLKDKLKQIKNDVGEKRYALYAVLLDMYQIEDCPEELGGILSINYDEYVEAAAKSVYGTDVDYGVSVHNNKRPKNGLTLLKLHGSFNWKDTWPIETSKRAVVAPLWMPPGIQKAKERYPFNILWGLAREMLNCDVLRIVGCRLSGNDWDLVSLLFATRHTQSTGKKPYVVEVIDDPRRACKLKEQYPYLDVKSIYEIEDLGVGQQLVSELIGGLPRSFGDLNSEEQERAFSMNYGGKNWFRMWLIQMAEAFVRDNLSLMTPSQKFASILGNI